jgi:hypothetical protein
MTTRGLAVLVGLALMIVIAGALLAEARAAGQSEADRCSMTCTVLMRHWDRKFNTMKAHEGDGQCWNTCWERFGTGQECPAADKKKIWMSRMGDNMRANQCAQACWRKFHDESNTVEVGGWRSAPRSVVCTP